MSREEQFESQENTEPFSWLGGEELDAQEVNTEDSDNYEWDNYRENPSFVERDLEEDLSVEQEDSTVPPTGKRASSTDYQFLENRVPPVQFIFTHNQENAYSVWPPRNPSSEPEFLPEENLLPAGLLDGIEEIEEFEEEVFFDTNLEEKEEKMPPKAPPTIEQLHDNLVEKVEEFDSINSCVETLGEPPDDDTIKEMDALNKAVRKLAIDMKRLKPDFASDYPNVGQERDRIFISLMKLRKAKENEVSATDGIGKAEEIDSTVSGLLTEFSMQEKEVNFVEGKMLKVFDEHPQPSKFEVADINKFLDDLRTAEKTAKPLYIKLAVEISKHSDEVKKTTKMNEVESAMKGLQ